MLKDLVRGLPHDGLAPAAVRLRRVRYPRTALRRAFLAPWGHRKPEFAVSLSRLPADLWHGRIRVRVRRHRN